MHLLARAIAQAGSTEGPRIKAALEDLAGTYHGVTGVYAKPFSPTDHEAVKADRVIMGVVRNGVVTAPAR
jgi:branched-chain amino acid transport system substrate-binding protein